MMGRRLLLTAAVSLLSGCSSVNWTHPDSADSMLPQRHERRTEAMVREFEARRNAVQMDAARAALDRGDPVESEQMLRSILQRDAAHRDARLLLAEVLLLSGRRPEAFTQLEHALREHDGDPQVYHAMAVLLDASGRPQEAQSFHEQAIELNPDFAVYASAHEAVRNAVKGADSIGPGPEGPDPTAGLAPAAAQALRQAREALAQGDLDSALASLQAAVAADPHNPRSRVRAAVLALEYNHPETAADLLEPAAAEFPASVAVHRTLGTAYYRLADYASAEAALRRALALNQSDRISRLLLGFTLEKRAELDENRRSHGGTSPEDRL